VFQKIDYLDFVSRWWPKARYDLASSGIRPVTPSELGTVAANDFSSRELFVSAVARHYAVPEREVLPTLGTSGALFATYATLLEPGARVLVETPGYEPLWRIAEALNACVDRFERRVEASYHIEIDFVLRRLKPDTRVVVVTNPHNPTAALATDDRLAELGRELLRHEVWLLVDEAYLEAARPGATARKLGTNVIACSSITKCWGVPWARAGWLLLPEALAERAREVERYVSGLAPPACWAWGERAFARAAELSERAERLQAGKRELVDAFLSERSQSFFWSPPPRTSPFGWLSDLARRSLTKRLEHGIETMGVMVSPGEFFGDPCALRLSWTTDIDALEQGLLLLGGVLDRPMLP